VRPRTRSARAWLGAALILVAAPGCRPAVPTEAGVRDVIDGDTVRLSDGRLVRYLGIDAPEARRRVGEEWVEDPEPFSRAATEANRLLVGGRTIRLEYDVNPTDRYGRLLAYVYVDGEMVNEALVREGLAVLLTIPPNVKHTERLRQAQEEARRAARGIWR